MAWNQMALQYRRGSKLPVWELYEHRSFCRKVDNFGLWGLDDCSTRALSQHHRSFWSSALVA